MFTEAKARIRPSIKTFFFCMGMTVALNFLVSLVLVFLFGLADPKFNQWGNVELQTIVFTALGIPKYLLYCIFLLPLSSVKFTRRFSIYSSLSFVLFDRFHGVLVVYMPEALVKGEVALLFFIFIQSLIFAGMAWLLHQKNRSGEVVVDHALSIPEVKLPKTSQAYWETKFVYAVCGLISILVLIFCGWFLAIYLWHGILIEQGSSSILLGLFSFLAVRGTTYIYKHWSRAGDVEDVISDPKKD